MKTILVASMLLLSYCSYSQPIPYAEFSAGYATNNTGVFGMGIGVEMPLQWEGILLGLDVRLQSSSKPILVGLKTGWFRPFDCDAKQALLITGGAYVAKKNNHTKHHVSELGLTGAIRFYKWRYIFIEPYWQYSEEKHFAGLSIGITGWIDK